MSEPFYGEIKMVGFDFPPRGWALCNGAILQVQQNTELYSLLSYRFGGNGYTTFALPDMQARMPLHMGSSVGTSHYSLGESGGLELVPLDANQMPTHTHPVTAGAKAFDGSGDQSSPVNHTWAVPGAMGETPYSNFAPNQDMQSGSVDVTLQNTGGGQAHYNVPPYLCVNFVIALTGRYPKRN